MQCNAKGSTRTTSMTGSSIGIFFFFSYEMPRKLVLLGFHVYALYSQYKLAGKKVFSIYKSYYARGITWITSLIDYPVVLVMVYLRVQSHGKLKVCLCIFFLLKLMIKQCTSRFFSKTWPCHMPWILQTFFRGKWWIKFFGGFVRKSGFTGAHMLFR